MTDTNSIGLRIAAITITLLLGAFGIFKGAEFGIMKYRQSQVQNNSVVPIASIAPTVTPEAPLTPELEQELSILTGAVQQSLIGYTKKYIESLPADIPKDEVLDQKNVQGFVDANRGVLLATLPAGTIKTTTASGKKAIQTYLDSISASHNKAIAPVTGTAIIAALGKQQSGEDLEALAPIRTSLEQNFSLFSSVLSPKEAIALHTKLLQATQSLITNVKLLQDMRTDVVAGLIGQRNITDLNLVFADIASQIQALETKYKLE
ncbi:MAG: hypothetical protein A3C02_03365 [Candidatus Andersenbacteria bacterium RIFCSPHIGHO2_02_FULL_45_11]|uniref:Uncharacterized protein n=1 Tax=Candidatus Andersenbacteria bacterium RIFCSPHIGHO2_12_FULL_45_11 TaxID=1797281 RepID=A0A1G1X4V4_9BACT|nr:MAG: hypothetical protein A2805_03830 [Candidatus Andersenbacteria bacterium RIFCSPHIGHO2_01_FULL_46_36]OGY33476.1 MAG: hypothetical protein A3C02_03365 [Candidatus Andersenbacteria bacterium RIFCSPHIGHO2_02_FULL_45_11]OGY34831.1 MAG: hypothetical protein A3D99_02895 [Candidatus Andersenbacteria bacterium RIFCSPHIGHO2_12_FULL_45_11]